MSYEYYNAREDSEDEPEKNTIEFEELPLENLCRRSSLVFGILGMLFFLIHVVLFFVILIFIFPVYIAHDPYALIDREFHIWWPTIYLPCLTILLTIINIIQMPLEFLIATLSMSYFLTSSPGEKHAHPVRNLIVGLSTTFLLVPLVILHFFLFLLHMSVPLSLWQVTYWEIGTAAMAIAIPPFLVTGILYCSQLAGSGVINIMDLRVGEVMVDLNEERKEEERKKRKKRERRRKKKKRLRRRRKKKKKEEEKRKEIEETSSSGFRSLSSGSDDETEEEYERRKMKELRTSDEDTTSEDITTSEDSD